MTARYPWLPYVAPLAAYIALTSVEGALPPAWYPAAYAVKAGVVSIVAWLCRGTWSDARPAPESTGRSTLAVWVSATVVGVLVFGLWIGLDRWPGYPHLGGRAGFDPFAAVPAPAARILFLAARFYGLVLLVPVIEELFWRDFLLRYLSSTDDFRETAVGRFSLSAAAISAVAFAVSHPEWLAAAVTAAAYTLLLARTRSLPACIIAHSVTNLCLGVYILQTGAWSYW